MNNQQHVLLCVIGKTASGKDSLVDKLCKRTGWKKVISYTTRPRRNNEGNSHIFTDKDTYEQMQLNGNVAAYTEIAGEIYWTTVDQLYENDIYIIDPQGVKNLKKLDLPDLKLVLVYINTPDDLREQRALHQRGDDKSKFRAREHSEKNQFREMLRNEEFDYAIPNIDFANAYSVLKWIATVEGCWKNHMEDTAE